MFKIGRTDILVLIIELLPNYYINHHAIDGTTLTCLNYRKELSVLDGQTDSNYRKVSLLTIPGPLKRFPKIENPIDLMVCGLQVTSL